MMDLAVFLKSVLKNLIKEKRKLGKTQAAAFR